MIHANFVSACMHIYSWGEGNDAEFVKMSKPEFVEFLLTFSSLTNSGSFSPIDIYICLLTMENNMLFSQPSLVAGENFNLIRLSAAEPLQRSLINANNYHDYCYFVRAILVGCDSKRRPTTMLEKLK